MDIYYHESDSLQKAKIDCIMEPILDQLKKIIGDNEVLKTILAGAGILALLSLITLQIPLFLIFVFISVASFLQLQKKKSS